MFVFKTLTCKFLRCGMDIFLRGSEGRGSEGSEMSFRERERQTDMGFLVKPRVLAPTSSEAWPSWAA